MKRIYLLIGGALVLLFLIIFLSLFLSKNGKTGNGNTANSPTPTAIPPKNNATQNSLDQLKTSAPVSTSDFSITYNQSTGKFDVSIKDQQGMEQFANWAYTNGYPQLVEDGSVTNFQYSTAGAGTTITPKISPTETPQQTIIDFFSIFMNVGRGLENAPASTPTSITPTSGPTSNNQPSSLKSSSGLTYFGQCQSPFGEINLPGGNLCQCGCGETTVAMIASSYVSKDNNPEKIVNLYKNNGYSTCGSYASDARSVLESLGLKTTDYILDENPPIAAQKAGPILKKYVDAGWTLMALVYYKPNEGGGHYFWITNIDNNGNILAYDPYYGQGRSLPLNENQYDPFPEYSQVFGVKQ